MAIFFPFLLLLFFSLFYFPLVWNVENNRLKKFKDKKMQCRRCIVRSSSSKSTENFLLTWQFHNFFIKFEKLFFFHFEIKKRIHLFKVFYRTKTELFNKSAGEWQKKHNTQTNKDWYDKKNYKNEAQDCCIKVSVQNVLMKTIKFFLRWLSVELLLLIWLFFVLSF